MPGKSGSGNRFCGDLSKRGCLRGKTADCAGGTVNPTLPLISRCDAVVKEIDMPKREGRSWLSLDGLSSWGRS